MKFLNILTVNSSKIKILKNFIIKDSFSWFKVITYFDNFLVNIAIYKLSCSCAPFLVIIWLANQINQTEQNSGQLIVSRCFWKTNWLVKSYHELNRWQSCWCWFVNVGDIFYKCRHFVSNIRYHKGNMVTLMLVTSLFWWLNVADHFVMMVTSLFVTFFFMLLTFQSVTNIKTCL